MKGVSLQIYTYEFQKKGKTLLYEWLLAFAKKNGIKGGSVFKGIAGYGKHGVIHEEHFFELASNVPLKVEFILQRKKANAFLKLLKKEKVPLFYTISSVEFVHL